MKSILKTITLIIVGLCVAIPTYAQNVSAIERQKQEAEQEIRETKAELNVNERKVNAGLASLRKIEQDIASSQKEIETVRGQLETINGRISTLEENIDEEETSLKALRAEYLKAVKKMRVARKQNSDMAFLFSSGSFNEARRRMRYMKEFSDWKDRRSAEIAGKVALLQNQRQQLTQARNDANVALQREQTAQNRLAQQRDSQQATVAELRANSDALRTKLAKRQAEARKLSNQISQLIAEQKAKEAREAEERRKAEEARRRAEEEQRRQAEERRLAEERKAKEAREKESTKPKEKEPAQIENPLPDNTEYADARKRSRKGTTSGGGSTAASTTPAAETVSLGFEGMKGRLPRPVGGSFKIISEFGVHPISPELPDIMDENLGIDAHVANGANAVAVYDGEVLKVYDRTNTPGFRNIIVLRHGDYITVYANLETLAVKSGQSVNQGQTLGAVGSDFDDPSQGMIHFEVWKNQTHLDPAKWIQ